HLDNISPARSFQGPIYRCSTRWKPHLREAKETGTTFDAGERRSPHARHTNVRRRKAAPPCPKICEASPQRVTEHAQSAVSHSLVLSSIGGSQSPRKRAGFIPDGVTLKCNRPVE